MSLSKRHSSSQRGFALLLVTLSISLLSVVVHIFVFRTKNELKAARIEGQKTKARFVAYSALELTKLFLKVQAKVFDGSAMLKNLGLDMGQILPMILPMFLGEGSAITGMLGVDLEGVGLTKEQGSGGLEYYKSEDGKLNLNCAINPSSVQKLTLALVALFQDRRYDELFQRYTSDRDALDREQLVGAIIDFIDIDQAGSGANGGDEEGYYMSLREPYQSKNNLLDSQKEMDLIRGMDPLVQVNFGRSMTVYGSCTINLCAVEETDWVLLAGIIAAAAKNPADPVVTDPVKLKILATTVGPQLMGICKDLNNFVQAVQFPGVASSLMASTMGVSVDAMSDLGGDGVQDSEVQGVELDSNKLRTLVGSGTKRFYRIKAFGLAGAAKHTVEVVWDQLAINQSTGGTGAYVYWREE